MRDRERTSEPRGPCNEDCSPSRRNISTPLQLPVTAHQGGVARSLLPKLKPQIGTFRRPIEFGLNEQGFSCMTSNITSNDAFVSEGLIAKYNVTGVGAEFLTETMNPGLRCSGDCLTLNVWTKPQTRGQSPIPVGHRRPSTASYVTMYWPPFQRHIP
jgi:hypothetical protein